MRILLLIHLFVLFNYNSVVHSQELRISHGGIENRLKEYAISFVDSSFFEGSILVAKGNEILFESAFGFSNNESKNQINTKYPIASLTKAFTSMGIMILVQEGRIDLNSYVSNYLPYYRDDTGDKVTIHHLLTHTSGILNYTRNPDYFSDKKEYKVQEFVEAYCSGDLVFEPGTDYRYSNTGYYLLGAIIESVTGISYSDFLKNRIFDPIGMVNTGTLWNGRPYGLAIGFYTNSRNGRESVIPDYRKAFSAGMIYSNVQDMHKWSLGLINNALINDSLTSIMFKPELSDYAYGWRITNIEDFKVATHFGKMPGFTSKITVSLNENNQGPICIIVLSNNAGHNLDPLTSNILQIISEEVN